jgi:hypothetical protein
LGFARLLFEDIKWSEISRNGWPKSIVPVGRGLLLATPPLFAFTLLLTKTDLVFGKMVSTTFHQIFDNFFVHLFFIGIYAGIAGGIVRDLLWRDKETTSGGLHSPSFSLGIVETSMILGSVNLLFLVFVIVQFRYYFGGAATVELTAGLTYAEYARRGFFELVTVSAMVLPLLLAIHWLLRKENPKHERLFRLHAGAQLLMLFVIMVSALQRMRLYQREYGMTELRLYTTAFMIWLAFAFIWFALTVLRGQRERFAFGAVVAGLSMFVVLLGLNPDGLIIHTNTERVKAGHGFDAKYATSLSADAIPNLITALPVLPDSARAVVATHLLKTWGSLKNQDWRIGNYSRLRAKSEIQSRLDYLQGIVLFNKNSSRSEYGQ